MGKPANKATLVKILQYHAVSGKSKVKDLKEGANELTTLQGAKVTVTKATTGVTIGETKVTKADQEADNGVVHIIDKVLMPPVAKTSAPNNSSNASASGCL